MLRIYLLDMSVLAHTANGMRLSNPVQRKRGWLGSWFRANLVSIAALDWVVNREASDTPIIAFALDSKPYWRAKALAKHGIAYKKTSARKLNRTRKGLSYVKSLLAKSILEAGLPLLGLPGQEADDIASLIVRSKPLGVGLRLVTTDNDWCGLIDPANNVDWYCMHGYLPRHRSALEHVCQSTQGQKMSLTSLADFYPVKQKLGDKGDNVPPNAPAWATNILNPPPEYDALKTSEGQLLCEGLYGRFDYYAKATKLLGAQANQANAWFLRNDSVPILY